MMQLNLCSMSLQELNDILVKPLPAGSSLFVRLFYHLFYLQVPDSLSRRCWIRAILERFSTSLIITATPYSSHGIPRANAVRIHCRT